MNTSTFIITHIKTPRSYTTTSTSSIEYYDEERWSISSKKHQNMNMKVASIRWIYDKKHYRLEILGFWNNIIYSTIFNSKNLEKFKKIEEVKKHSLEIYRILMEDFIKRIGIDYKYKLYKIDEK